MVVIRDPRKLIAGTAMVDFYGDVTGNLHGDAKGKGTSGANREAESTNAPVRGGLLRSSAEAGVMPVERREQVIAICSGKPAREEPDVQWKAAAFVRWHEPDKSRGLSPVP